MYLNGHASGIVVRVREQRAHARPERDEGDRQRQTIELRQLQQGAGREQHAGDDEHGARIK